MKKAFELKWVYIISFKAWGAHCSQRHRTAPDLSIDAKRQLGTLQFLGSNAGMGLDLRKSSFLLKEKKMVLLNFDFVDC